MFWQRCWVFLLPVALLLYGGAYSALAEERNSAATREVKRTDIVLRREQRRFVEKFESALAAWQKQHRDKVKAVMIEVDPFTGGGADLFTPDADPFGSVADPFSGKKPVEKVLTEAEKQEREIAKIDRWAATSRLFGIVGIMRSRFLLHRWSDDTASDAQFFEAMLSLAHAEHVDAFGCVNLTPFICELSQRKWQRPGGESTDVMLKRFAVVADDGTPSGKLNYCSQKFTEDTGAPFPFAWRDEKELWLDIAQLVIEGHRLDNPTAAWEALIARHENGGCTIRAAYLGWARAHPTSPFSAAFVRPLIDNPRTNPGERVARWAETIHTLHARGIAADHPARIRLHTEMMDGLHSIVQGERQTSRSRDYEVAPLASLSEVLEEEELSEIMKLMMMSGSDSFERFCDLAEVDVATRHRFCREQSISFDRQPEEARALLAHLADRSSLPIWLDESVQSSDVQITLSGKGAWHEMLHSAIEAAGYTQVALADDSLIWIGTKERQPAAVKFFNESQEKAMRLDESRQPALLEPSIVSVHNMELDDVLFRFEWDHEVSITALGSYQVGKQKVSSQHRTLPVHLALSLLCRDKRLDWTVQVNSIAVGPPDTIVRFDAAARNYHQRQAEIAKLPAPIGKRMQELTLAEFIETPVEDVMAYFSDLHEICIAVDGRALPANGAEDKDLYWTSMTERGIPLAWGIMRAISQTPLDWWCDGEVIYISNEEGLREIKQRVGRREQARKEYPDNLRVTLAKAYPLTSRYGTKLIQITDSITKESGLVVRFDELIEIGELPVPTSNVYANAPLDKALDMLMREVRLAWRIVDGEIVIEKP